MLRHKQGKPIDTGFLYMLLNNRLYFGEAVRKGQGHPGGPIALQSAFAEHIRRMDALADHLDAAAAKAEAMAAGLSAEVLGQPRHKGIGHAGAQAGQ